MSAAQTALFKIWRGNAKGGEFRDYRTEISEGMVVLDAVNQIQATQATTLHVDGTARRGSADRVRRKSTACRSLCA